MPLAESPWTYSISIMQAGAGFWDWQSRTAKDLNDSQDPKHPLFCRKIAFVVIYAHFSDNKCPLFTRLEGGGRPKQALSAFFTAQSGHCLLFYRFFYTLC